MIGDLLRAERERQNLSIKDVERGTSIRSLYIEAIEKGEYKTLPGEVYTKGFIRNYANFLKLDADAAVKQFNEERHPDHPVAESGAQQPSEEEKATEVKVAVKFTGRCWVSVKADGKTLFEGTVEKGETKEWTADQRLDLTAGNAGAVTLSYNGEDQGVLGKEGEVVEKTYRLDGAADAVDATAEKSAAKKKK